jgi:hypothetical protein
MTTFSIFWGMAHMFCSSYYCCSRFMLSLNRLLETLEIGLRLLLTYLGFVDKEAAKYDLISI